MLKNLDNCVPLWHIKYMLQIPGCELTHEKNITSKIWNQK